MFSRIVLTLLIGLIITPTALGQNSEADNQFALASDHYRNARWKLASEGFSKLTAQFPNDAKSDLARFFQGETALQLRDYRSGAIYLKQFLDRLPNHHLAGRARFRMGECYYLLGKNLDAIKILKESISDPNGKVFREFSLLYLGEMIQRSDDPVEIKESQSYLHTGLKEFASSSLSDRYRMALARGYRKLGQTNQAKRFFGYLLSSQDKEIASQSAIAMASIEVGSKRWQEAKQLIQGISPTDLSKETAGERSYWLGRAEMGLGNWAAAANHLQNATESISGTLLRQAAFFDAAVSFKHAGNSAESDKLLRDYIQKWPNGRWISGVSFLYIESAKKPNRPRLLLQRIQQIPRTVENSVQWGMIQESGGRAAFGLKDYQQAANIFQDLVRWAEKQTARNRGLSNRHLAQFSAKWKPTWVYLLGLNQLNLSKYQDAVQTMDEVVRLNNGKTDAQARWLKTHAQYAQVSALMKQTRWDQAVNVSKKLLAEPLSNDLKIKIHTDLLNCYGKLQDFANIASTQRQLEKLQSGTKGVSADLVGYARSQQENSALTMAQTFYQKKDWKQAEKWFRMASSSKDRQLAQKGLSGLAWCHYRSGKMNSPEAFRTLLNRFPNSVYTAEVVVYQANQYLVNEKDKKAKELLESVVDRFENWPSRDQIFATLAKIELKENRPRSRKKAIEYLEKAIQIKESQLRDPSADLSQVKDRIAGYRYQLAWAYTDSKKDRSASTQFQAIYLSFPQSKYWAEAAYRSGNRSYQAGKFAEAVDAWDAILSADKKGRTVSDDVMAHTLFMYAMLGVRKGDWTSTKDHAGRLVTRYPNHSLAHQAAYWVGESQYRKGHYKESVETLTEVLSRTRGVNLPWAAMCHLRLAQGLAQQAEWFRSQEVALQIQEKFPDFSLQFEADCLIGRAYASEGEFQKARTQYQKVIDSEKGGSTETAAMAQWLIGESFFHQEKFQEAADAYHKCSTLYSYPKWKAISLLQAGKCYENLGRSDVAIAFFKQITKEHPNSSLAERAGKRLTRLGAAPVDSSKRRIR